MSANTQISIKTSAEMEHLLKLTLVPDTKTVAEASEVLKKLKGPEITALLFEVAKTSQFPEIRQSAYIQIRRRITKIWAKFPSNAQEEIKKMLLERLVTDTHPLVQRSCSAVISNLARMLIPVGQWKELLNFLFECAQSSQANTREMSLSLFDVITENLGDTLKPHFGVLQSVILKGLSDQEPKVRLASLKAVNSLSRWISEEADVKLFAQLIPCVEQVVKWCIVNHREEEASLAFEMYDDLFEMPIANLGSVVVPITKFCLEVGNEKGCSLKLRKQALTVVEWIATYKPKSILKNDLVKPILSIIFSMMAEADAEDLDEDEDITAHKFAAQVLDVHCLHLDPKVIFPIASEFVAQLIKSTDGNHRRAAIIALGVMSEGCGELMHPHLDTLLALLYGAFADKEKVVREASCISLGLFSQHLQPTILEHYEKVLPILVESLLDPTKQVRMGSLYALESFCDQLEENHLGPYLAKILTQLIELLKISNKQTQAIIISSLTSICSAAGKDILPYFEPLILILRNLVTLTADEDLVLRCRATECIGILALAAGRKAFEPYAKELLENTIKGCSLNYPELREFGYGFFAHMAELFGSDFGDSLHYVVPLVIASLASNEGIVGLNDQDDDAHVTDDEEDDEEGEGLNYHIRTAFLDEKAAAVHAVGAFAEFTKKKMVPYLDKIIKELLKLSSYFHEDVREGVAKSFYRISNVLFDAFPPPKPYVKGVSVKINPMVNEHKQYLDIAVPELINMIQNDEDREVVSTVLECLGGIMKIMGIGAVEPYFPMLATQLLKILQKESCCQTVHQDPEEDDLDDDLQSDVLLIDTCCDLIIEGAIQMGTSITPYFEAIANALAPYFNDTKNSNYRTMAIGAFSELANALGVNVVTYKKILFEFAFAGMKDAEPQTRSNATYLCGILFQNAGDQVSEYSSVALSMLSELYQDKSGLPNLVDNCCGMMCRMIMGVPKHVPVAQMLPILMNHLPLKADFAENETVFTCVLRLIDAQNEEMTKLLPQAMKVFSMVLGDANVPENVQKNIVLASKAVLAKYGNKLVEGLSNEQKQNLEKFLA